MLPLVLPLAKGELEGVLLLKQKNLPRPLFGKEGSVYSQPRYIAAATLQKMTSAHHAERDGYIACQAIIHHYSLGEC